MNVGVHWKPSLRSAPGKQERNKISEEKKRTERRNSISQSYFLHCVCPSSSPLPSSMVPELPSESAQVTVDFSLLTSPKRRPFEAVRTASKSINGTRRPRLKHRVRVDGRGGKCRKAEIHNAKIHIAYGICELDANWMRIGSFAPFGFVSFGLWTSWDCWLLGPKLYNEESMRKNVCHHTWLALALPVSSPTPDSIPTASGSDGLGASGFAGNGSV